MWQLNSSSSGSSSSARHAYTSLTVPWQLRVRQIQFCKVVQCMLLRTANSCRRRRRVGPRWYGRRACGAACGASASAHLTHIAIAANAYRLCQPIFGQWCRCIGADTAKYSATVATMMTPTECGELCTAAHAAWRLIVWHPGGRWNAYIHIGVAHHVGGGYSGSGDSVCVWCYERAGRWWCSADWCIIIIVVIVNIVIMIVTVDGVRHWCALANWRVIFRRGRWWWRRRWYGRCAAHRIVTTSSLPLTANVGA